MNGELCVVDARGEPVRGLTNVSSEFDRSLGSPGKRVLPLANPAEGGERIDIWADAGCNDLFGNRREDGKVREAHIAICNEVFRCLYYDFEVLHGLAKELGPDTARGCQIFDALDRAAKTLRDFTPEEAETAHFEIQFGHIARATHTNTSWDMAKDEVAAHKWADLSQRDYGVALLNDCKYGHKVKGKTLDLALIRSLPHPGSVVFDDSKLKPGEPNHKFGDQCDHELRYALLPHQGDHVEGGVARAAYEFNIKPGELTLKSGAAKTKSTSTLSISSPDDIVEAVKLSEDRKAVVFRLYEASRAKVRCRVSLGFPAKTVEEANLLEEPLGRLTLKDGAVELEFAPFEIKTLVAKV